MDYQEIFTSCRVGDLEKVKYLVETRDVELNARDKWDTTPLYYACLCGHEQVVKYLLENGARCEANTFDGERCLYAALNDQIKKLLKNYKMITSTTMRRDVFDEFLRRLMYDSEYTDATFKVQADRFYLHRCVVAARCPQLLEKLQRRLDQRKTITVKDLNIDPSAFVCIINYIYTGRLQTNYENLSSVELLARRCGLSALVLQLEKKLKEKKSFECTKPGTHVEIFHVDSSSDKQRLKMDLTKLVEQAMPVDLNAPLSVEMPFPQMQTSIYPDMHLMVEGHKFMCHKLFFCTRSDYFKALLEDHFMENDLDPIPVIHLSDVSIDVFICVLYYVYTDSCELKEDNVFEVLYKADMYLLPGLKRICATFIANLIDTDNVFSILQVARLFNQAKLEDLCYEFIAEYIEEMVERDEFSQLIIDDAHSIEQRQESDSIDVVDNVRYHLTGHVQTFSEMEEATRRLQLIDDLLDSLGLDC